MTIQFKDKKLEDASRIPTLEAWWYRFSIARYALQIAYPTWVASFRSLVAFWSKGKRRLFKDVMYLRITMGIDSHREEVGDYRRANDCRPECALKSSPSTHPAMALLLVLHLDLVGRAT